MKTQVDHRKKTPAHSTTQARPTVQHKRGPQYKTSAAHSATQVQHSATQVQECVTRGSHTATHCNTLQHATQARPTAQHKCNSALQGVYLVKTQVEYHKKRKLPFRFFVARRMPEKIDPYVAPHTRANWELEKGLVARTTQTMHMVPFPIERIIHGVATAPHCE